MFHQKSIFKPILLHTLTVKQDGFNLPTVNWSCLNVDITIEYLYVEYDWYQTPLFSITVLHNFLSLTWFNKFRCWSWLLFTIYLSLFVMISKWWILNENFMFLLSWQILEKLYGSNHIVIGYELMKLSSIQLSLGDTAAMKSISRLAAIFSWYYGPHADMMFPYLGSLKREICKLVLWGIFYAISEVGNSQLRFFLLLKTYIFFFLLIPHHLGYCNTCFYWHKWWDYNMFDLILNPLPQPSIRPSLPFTTWTRPKVGI